MSLAITSVNCQKSQLQSHKKPNFTGSFSQKDINPLEDFVKTHAEKKLNFPKSLKKISEKIRGFLFKDEQGVKLTNKPKAKSLPDYENIPPAPAKGSYGEGSHELKVTNDPKGKSLPDCKNIPPAPAKGSY